MFCDYCDCASCYNGSDGMFHAQTVHGSWICDICYLYDLCTAKGLLRSFNGPCPNKDCPHRPTLITPWIKYDLRKNYHH